MVNYSLSIVVHIVCHFYCNVSILYRKGNWKDLFLHDRFKQDISCLDRHHEFSFFKEVKIPQSKFINTIAASTFGVLLIHANSDTMRHWLWKTVCNNASMYSSDLIYIHAILIPITVFAVCIIIDHIRIKTIEEPAINFCLKYAEMFKEAAIHLENKIIIK